MVTVVQRESSSLFLSYTRSFCACFKKPADIYFPDLSAFLCKRPEEVLEVVSGEESYLYTSRDTINGIPHGVEGANAVECTVTR